MKPTPPILDCLALLLLPLVLNLASMPGIPAQRSLVIGFFGLLLLKNVLLFPALSITYAREANTAFGEVFSRRNGSLWLLVAVTMLYTLAEMRSGYAGTSPTFGFVGVFLRFVLIMAYLLSVVAMNRSERARGALLASAVAGLGLFVAVNLVAFAAGMRGELADVGTNKMLSLIGVRVARGSFPFAAGVNNFGMLAGLALMGGFALAWAGKARWVAWPVALLGLAGLVVADSRASFAIASLICAAVAIIPARPLGAALRWAPALALVAPLALYGVNAMIRDNSSAQQVVVRDGSFAQRLGPLTGRDVVWESGMGVLADAKPIHLVGYGAFGQASSGATKGYAWIFSEPARYSLHSLHNAPLQIVMDIGYLGLAVWLLMWVTLTRRLSAMQSGALSAMAAFIVFGGVMEVAGTPVYPDVFVVLMLMVAGATVGPKESQIAKTAPLHKNR